MSEENKDPLQSHSPEEQAESDKPAEETVKEASTPAEAPADDKPAAEKPAAKPVKARPAAVVARPAAGKTAAAAGGGMKSWPWIAVSAIAIAALIFVLVRDSNNGSMDKAVGELNGKSITQSDLYNDMVTNMGEAQMGQSLDQMMTVQLIDNEAKKTGGTVSDADIDAYIAEIKKENNFETDDQFSQALASSGMTIDQFREQVRPQLELRLIFDQKLKPTDDDLKAYFDQNKDSFGTPEQVRASHILLSTKEEAEAVLKQLKQGADFATLAKEKSIDTGSKDNGGDLGFFGKGVMNEQFETAAFALKKGEMSDVVQSPNGYHIIKVTDRKDAVVPTYDEVKDQVKGKYLDEKISAGASDWIAQAKKDEGYKNFLTKEDATTAEPSPSLPAAPSGSAESSAPAASEPASPPASPSSSPSAAQ